MNIAFYAPLKSPNHPVPSGDRLMARLLISALRMAGHTVEIASELRGFMSMSVDDPENGVANSARKEASALMNRWTGAAPDLWFTYHTYYKAPDLLGPPIASRFGIPYVTAEASYSRRHDADGWAANQRLVASAVRQASVNLCFTERDRVGLQANIPQGRYERLLPFLDAGGFRREPEDGCRRRLITVAMMRPGDKLDSYAMLAKALERIAAYDWRLTVIGSGPAAADVQSLFSGIEPGRIEWLGQRSTDDIAAELAKGGIYVWPGCGEAYGLAYLEAQACGLPVVAQSTAGVPEVVVDGVTGLLTPEGDLDAFSRAVVSLLEDAGMRQRMGQAAFDFVHAERALPVAAERLGAILKQYVEKRNER